MLVINSLSKIYVRVPVSGDAADLTVLPVQMAIVTRGTAPVAGDWQTATWLGTDEAALLVGPGTDVVLTEGTYDVYVKITDPPEAPVLKAGFLVVKD